jgi:hypothetical protein
MQAPELSRQVRALHALQALTKSKAGSDNVQNAFREAGGIQCLIRIMGNGLAGTEPGTEEHVAKCKAVEGFFFLCRNNPESRYLYLMTLQVCASLIQIQLLHYFPETHAVCPTLLILYLGMSRKF